ncbi:MAG: CoA-binding protein [Saprospiraceae bacterium]|nr:CoA-binding protein [Saprospiraceae bacterium]
MKKKTVVLGATPNKTRYAYTAVNSLSRAGHEAVPIGIKTGDIEGIEIMNGTPEVDGVDTVTLYLGAERQKPYYDYIFSLHPKRIIFNPGTENPELEAIAAQKGIETINGCTLVMLAIGNY